MYLNVSGRYRDIGLQVSLVPPPRIASAATPRDSMLNKRQYKVTESHSPCCQWSTRRATRRPHRPSRRLRPRLRGSTGRRWLPPTTCRWQTESTAGNWWTCAVPSAASSRPGCVGFWNVQQSNFNLRWSSAVSGLTVWHDEQIRVKFGAEVHNSTPIRPLAARYRAHALSFLLQLSDFGLL